jgi:hypothetical protein
MAAGSNKTYRECMLAATIAFFRDQPFRSISAARQRRATRLLREASSLPMQLVIGGLPKKEGAARERVGCLVFMVSTEVGFAKRASIASSKRSSTSTAKMARHRAYRRASPNVDGADEFRHRRIIQMKRRSVSAT